MTILTVGYVYENTWTPGGCLLLPWGYIYVYDQYFQKFFSETAGPLKAKFYVALPLGVGTNSFTYGLGHMAKMLAMPIYSINL